MLAALDPLAVEVVAAGTRLEREAQHIDEQLATLLRIRRDHRNAGDELNIHARSVWPVPNQTIGLERRPASRCSRRAWDRSARAATRRVLGTGLARPCAGHPSFRRRLGELWFRAS